MFRKFPPMRLLAFALNTRVLFRGSTRLVMTEDYLRLDDGLLLRQCRVDVRRDSGPGGQKRNKIESAVRITHEPTSIVANAADERSQARNKEIALKRLRNKIAMTVRRTETWLSDDLENTVFPEELLGYLPWKKSSLVVGKRSELRPIAQQALLDVLDASKGSLAVAAKTLGTTTSQLSKLITNDDDLLDATNTLRRQYDVFPLRRSR